MDSLISNVASTALTSLGSLALQEAAAAWHFKSDLDDLTETIRFIRGVLLAHEGHRQRHDLDTLIDRLKDAVHEADDLIDEFTTLVERRKVMTTGSGRFTKEYRVFFSRENQVRTAFKISREIKRIRNTLNKTVGDRDQFAPMLLPYNEASPAVIERDTCSFVRAEEVIGRDDDKQKILDVLLMHEHHDDPGSHMVVLSIFGIGGLGKTTIAQLVFNDKVVQGHFELKLWVCIGDFIGDELDLKLIIRKIIMSATDSSCSDDLGLEQLHRKLREKMGGKKYLLVLDDLWEEDPNKLFLLRDLLAVGGKGSKVLVTTRSMDTAGRIGTIPPMGLQFLSDDASWTLFEKMTGLEQRKDQRLVQIGKEIVKKCANLPLAIKVIGSLLHGKDETEWRHFKDRDLAKIDAASGIMPLLKLSYYRLHPQLKHCFTYCSLFPKDSAMKKIQLCYLWIAQGFITPYSHPNESSEDVAEQCFMELLHRCFFQDIQMNELGEIETVKMHDLIHDLAKEVAGKEILVADGSGDQNNLAGGVRHLNIIKFSSVQNLPSFCQGGNHLRTFLRPSYGSRRLLEVSNFINSFQCIKVLELHQSGIEQLLESIGKLIHLRYLDLSGNGFEVLPESITRLHNLETLNLAYCGNLKELPWDLRKLVNLQNLDVEGCYELACMPSGMGGLTRLQRLTRFVVGEGMSASTTDRANTHCGNSKPHIINASGLNDLFFLKNLRGSLRIDISSRGISDRMSIRTKAASCLCNMSNLTKLSIRMNSTEPADEELLECLQPHSHLKGFFLSGHYAGKKFPSWMSMDNLGSALPNLVEIKLKDCSGCLNLPILSRLRSLKIAELWNLPRLEYIESQSYEASASKSVEFFPSLQHLNLIDLPNVKGWWTPTGDGTDLDSGQHVAHPSLPPFFPHLTRLTIYYCPNMTSMPSCPHLEELELSNFNENLHIIMDTEECWTSTSKSSSSSAPNSCSSSHLLKSLKIDNIGYLNRPPKQRFQSLTKLCINGCNDVSPSWSFLQHLTELVRLKIEYCPALHFSASHAEEEDRMAWKSLERLRRLTISWVPKLTTLPKGLEYLTNLQEVWIRGCDNLVELPGWIGQLSSLESLEIEDCEGLKSLPDGIRDLTSLRRISVRGCGEDLLERCRKLTGEDWQKIQHVPVIIVD